MTGTPVTFATLPSFFEIDVLFRWLPGLGFALTAFIIMRRFHHFMIMPVLIFSAFVIFYIVLFATGTSVHDAREAGWLIHASSEGGLFEFLTFESLTKANWSVIAGQAGSIATVLLVGAISILLNSSALELASEQEMDLDRELKAAGAANILSGFFGGMIGFTSLTISGLALKMGAKSRLVGVMTAIMCGVVLFMGASVLSYFPEPIIGGLLLFLGLEFLTEWVYDSYSELPFTDYLIILLILAVVGLFGFLHGVFIGVIAAIIIFVVKYSRIDIVKHVLSGTNNHSNVDRPPRHRKIVREKGERLFILKLHGYVFFGTANGLLNRVRDRSSDEVMQDLRYVAIDFREVDGIDASAIISLSKMNILAKRKDFFIVLTHLSKEIDAQMRKGGLFESDDHKWKVCPDLDHGIEWCEDHMLLAEGKNLEEEKHTLKELLEEMVPGTLEYGKLEQYLERFEVGPDHYIIRQSDSPDDLYFVESGKISVLIELENGEKIRVRKMGAGSVVGEMGMYLDQKRAASVITRTPAVIYRLSKESLLKMEENNPKTASTFHNFMVRLLSQRLMNTDKTLKALLD